MHCTAHKCSALTELEGGRKDAQQRQQTDAAAGAEQMQGARAAVDVVVGKRRKQLRAHRRKEAEHTELNNADVTHLVM